MEKRWTLFLIVTLLIYLFFISMINKQQRARKKQLEAMKQEEMAEQDQAPSPTIKEQEAPVAPDSEKPEKTLEEEETEEPSPPPKKETTIPVHTELYDILLTNRGGRPVRWDLLVHNSSSNDEHTTQALPLIELLGNEEDRELPLEVDFREYNSLKSYNTINRMVFEEYNLRELPNGDIEVVFHSPLIEGISISKRYVFRKNSHLTDLSITMHNSTESDIVINDGGKGLGLSWGPGLGRLIGNKDPYLKRFSRSAYSLEKGGTHGFKASEKSQEASGDILWAGQNTRFLFTAIIPQEEKGAFFKSVVRTKNLIDEEGEKRDFSILPSSAMLWLKKATLPAGASKSYSFKLFVGPRNYTLLRESGYELSRAMFYTHWGWVRSLCIMMLFVLHWLYGILHNFGLAIIGLTILVRVATYPLTHKGMKLQAKAMAEQAKIRPYIEELNEKYKDNPQLKNKKLMELYKEHGINPLGFLRGCLPLFIQMPIFISLYFLLSESFELRGSGFLWIKDLSSPDRLVHFGSSLPLLGSYLNLLPILMGISQIFVSKFTSTAAADPSQRTMMYFFPIFFTFIVYNLSSGLVLYWLVSNLLHAGQQLIINKHMKKEQMENA